MTLYDIQWVAFSSECCHLCHGYNDISDNGRTVYLKEKQLSSKNNEEIA